MMKANLDALDTATRELRERRVDLSRRVSLEEDKGMERLAKVEGWLSRAESIDSEVSVLLTEKPTETKRLCLFGYCSKKCISSCEYGKDVSEMLEEVKEHLSKGGFQDVAEKRPAAKVVKQDIQTTIGLDSMVKKAWDSIMKPEGRTLGIYGMGGVGKTTLLATINNKFKDEFDVVIWVVVSKDLQYDGIRNQILRRLRVDKEWEKETEKEKASSIKCILERKKFILLLDDLWSEVDLNEIGVPRPTQENGSKIVFTSRSEEVCSDMEAADELKIDCLSTNDAWELFETVVGEDTLKRHPDIPSLAKRISEKCYGLPLALNVIGKAMKCKKNVHEWRDAIDVLSTESHKFPGMEENILSILKFSYDSLEDEKVKSCFLYCSLFPEYYEINKEELIEYWISEGFIKRKRYEDGCYNKGYVIIGSLVPAHLLMESETAVKMHDVLREMAIWIGSTSGKEEERQCVKTGAKLSRIRDDINWSDLRRISLMSNQIEEISCCPECPQPFDSNSP
ncbi:Disease resistance protein (NBS class) family [Raphanus sativus]|nr:Disease resistance protein (NBS class) family [Raphanus sativus]